MIWSNQNTGKPREHAAFKYFRLVYIFADVYMVVCLSAFKSKFLVSVPILFCFTSVDSTMNFLVTMILHCFKTQVISLFLFPSVLFSISIEDLS